MLKNKFAAQLYSLRKDFEKDCEYTIKTLKEIGFNAVQVDGMRGNDMHDVAKILKKYNMKIAGMHIKHDRFFNDVEGIIKEAELFGSKDIYDKYIDDEYQNEEGYRLTRETLRNVAVKLSSLGFRVGLHNPEYDFNNTIDGKRVLEYITAPFPEGQIYPEMDTYWVKVAGLEPCSYIQQFAGRMPIMHLKDFIPGFESEDMENNLTELGRGSVDFKSILQWGESNGVEYYAIEQDSSKGSMFDSMETSFRYMVQISEKLL